MSGAESRERAEAAFGHLQHAARELIAAAHDTLDLCEQVVSSADLHEVIDGFSHLSHLGQSVFSTARFKWARSGSGPTTAGSGAGEPRAGQPGAGQSRAGQSRAGEPSAGQSSSDEPPSDRPPSGDRARRAPEGRRPRGPVQRISVV